mgnify:CR=1 FL=1
MPVSRVPRMITLSKKIKEEKERREKGSSTTDAVKCSRVPIRDKLLVKGSYHKLQLNFVFAVFFKKFLKLNRAFAKNLNCGTFQKWQNLKKISRVSYDSIAL